MAENKLTPQEAGLVAKWVLGLLMGFVVLTCVGCPYYAVWTEGMKGQAELARAQQNRQIRVAEAEAEKESARLHAEAEVERAKGVAKANEIIGVSLEGHENYLRYLWISKLSENGQDVIYIPTEAGLPILESQRFQERRLKPLPDPVGRGE